MGNLSRARAAAREVLRIDPSFRIGSGLVGRFRHSEDLVEAQEALRKAGLPE
jgi:hypothetical protein